MTRNWTTLLKRLEALRETFGEGAEAAKLTALEHLRKARFKKASELLRYHEWLCFARAFPDGKELKQVVDKELGDFGNRPDLKKHRAELADSGIIGTTIHFRFFWQMAKRVVPLMPDAFEIDWEEFENADKLPELLHLLMPYSESPALDAYDFSPAEWVARLKSETETDAAFLVRRFLAMRASDAVIEHLYDSLDVPLVLLPTEETPSRTTEIDTTLSVNFQTGPLHTGRPDLKAEAQKQDFVLREVDEEEGRRLIDFANRAMIPRHRDLLVFLYGDERDVRIFDFGDGLQFVCIGTRPSRRLLLESVYGILTLRNGVATGYILSSALFQSCELAYNVFDTFRGVEAAHVYGRFVSAMHHLFNADCFTVDPYQMGHDNQEGQESGAWWFYYKLGFRPHDPAIKELIEVEEKRMKRNRKYRSSPKRIHELAAANMFLSLKRDRRDVLGSLALGNIGLGISEMLSKRFGGDRERGLVTCAREAGELLEFPHLSECDEGPRLAFERLAPLVMALPEVPSWPQADREALLQVVLKKGGRCESDYVRAFDSHEPLRKALLALAKRSK